MESATCCNIGRRFTNTVLFVLNAFYYKTNGTVYNVQMVTMLVTILVCLLFCSLCYISDHHRVSTRVMTDYDRW